jgi:predicted O-linked N-acetylglucosamine transferase (SPINDLY family)
MLVFRDTLKGLARERIGKEFTNRGIAAERLDLRSDVGPVGHLGVYKQIDVNLDAFPFTGGVTTCESLWMGVPVLSLRGNRPAGRNSSAILTRVGLSNWAVDSPDQFVEKAVKLQEALEDLASLRSQLRQKMQESLCDAARFTKGLEEAYRSMWQRWCAKHAGA